MKLLTAHSEIEVSPSPPSLIFPASPGPALNVTLSAVQLLFQRRSIHAMDKAKEMQIEQFLHILHSVLPMTSNPFTNEGLARDPVYVALFVFLILTKNGCAVSE